MPAKDTFHDAVVAALIKDGWAITHDPYTLSFGTTNVYSDLGAERPIAAQRGNEKIALEIKSFLSDSAVRELEIGLGQFVLYRMLMRKVEPDRTLLLAIPESAFKSLFEEPAGQRVIQEVGLKLAVFDPDREEIVQWLK
jgi:XisH protein